jgi:hypothetical protein
MKKLISGVLVLLTLAAAAYFVLKVGRFVPERSRAVELAPAETILFIHAANLRETARRFRKTGLFAIWQEPEMQEFLQKPRKTSPWMQLWEQRMERVTRVEPREAFLAVTSLEGPQPRFVAGFSFDGKRRELEALLAEPRADFKRSRPAGTSGSASHKGAAIETFTYPDGFLAECFVRNWYFIASDTTLLRATLDRYENTSAPISEALGGNEVFRQTTAPLGGGADLMLFGRVASLGELMPAAARFQKPGQDADPGKVQAFAASTRIEGTQMHDAVFILKSGEKNDAPFSRTTFALTEPETFLYFATGLASMTGIFESAGILATVLPGLAAIEEALEKRKLGWNEFGAAFGPGVATTFGWAEDAAVPAMLLALEVRDAAKARGFVEAITTAADGSPAWSRKDAADVSYYSAPGEESDFANPTIAITPRFALLGFSAKAVSAGLERMLAAQSGNTAGAPFEEAAKQVATPTAGYGYLDATVLFERAYRALRPALTMSLAFSGNLGDYIDAGKLPDAETISKHLTPSVFSQSNTPNGVLMESTGTLTFNQLIIGTVAGAFAAFSPGGETATDASDTPDEAPIAPLSKAGGDAELLKPTVAVPRVPGRPDFSPGTQSDTAIPAAH